MIPGELAEFARAQAEGDRDDEERLQSLVRVDRVVEAEVVPARAAGGFLEFAAHLGDAGVLVGLGAAGQLTGLGGGVGRAVAAVARFHHPDVAGDRASRGLQQFPGLILGHRPGRAPGLAGWKVDELDHVPADEVVDLGASDRPPERAFDHDQRPLAQGRGDLLEEPVRVGGAEVLELGRADPRIDPVPRLARHGLHRVLITLDGFKPVLDALLDGVGGGSAHACLELLMELVEPVFDLRLGLAAHSRTVAFTVGSVAKRDRADVGLVGLVP